MVVRVQAKLQETAANAAAMEQKEEVPVPVDVMRLSGRTGKSGGATTARQRPEKSDRDVLCERNRPGGTRPDR